uniref:Uncharacterized protein n=1 Tax=Arundo donax TaxID=35708 RepID=A0A0A9HF94_ARUDO
MESKELLQNLVQSLSEYIIVPIIALDFASTCFPFH